MDNDEIFCCWDELDEIAALAESHMFECADCGDLFSEFIEFAKHARLRHSGMPGVKLIPKV